MAGLADWLIGRLVIGDGPTRSTPGGVGGFILQLLLSFAYCNGYRYCLGAFACTVVGSLGVAIAIAIAAVFCYCCYC